MKHHPALLSALVFYACLTSMVAYLTACEPPLETDIEADVSFEFRCSYLGLQILEGLLIVPPEKADKFDPSWLSEELACTHPEYSKLKCELL